MRLLKFFLWITLLACIAWGAAIFLGPTVINRAVAAYFGDAVKVQRLDVSPALEVSAAAVKFDFPGRDGAPAVRGVSRGVTLDWSFDEVLTLHLGLGPTRLEELGFISSASLSFMPISNSDWSGLTLQGTIGEGSFGSNELELGRLSADLDTVNQVASDIQFDVENITIDVNGLKSHIPMAVMTVNEIKAGVAMAAQASDLQVQLPEGATYAGADSKSISLKGRLNSGNINFDVFGSELVIPDGGISVGTFNISATFDLIRKMYGPNLEFSLEDLNANTYGASIGHYSGKLTQQGRNFSHNGSGKIDSLTLRSGDNFLGEVNDTDFKFEISSTQSATAETSLRGATELDLTADFNFAMAVDASVEEAKLLRCLVESCLFSEITAKYVANVSEGRLLGSSYCAEGPCEFNTFRHKVRTDDTDKFFEGVSVSRIFSPLVVPFAYAAMKRGEQSGRGHILEF
jgi:hypothetical protein